jgi:rubrerythrin
MESLMSKAPQPLTDTDDIEAIMEHEPERLVVIDGKTYDTNDLFTCSSCGEHFLEDERDDNNRCPTCVQEAQDEADHRRYLRAWFHSTRL